MSTPTTLGSVGLRFVFFDGSDPLTDPNYVNRAADAATRCPTADQFSDPAGHQKCLENLPALTSPAWNANGLSLSMATSGAFANGSLRDRSWADSAVWLTGSIGFLDTMQLSGALEYLRSSETSKNVVAGSARFKYGGNSLRGYVEATLASDDPHDVENRKGRLMIGLDVKVTKGTWLNASVGGDYDFSGSPFGVFSLASLKYAFAGTPGISTD